MMCRDAESFTVNLKIRTLNEKNSCSYDCPGLSQDMERCHFFEMPVERVKVTECNWPIARCNKCLEATGNQ